MEILNSKNTLVYTHLVSFKEENAFTVKVAGTIGEFTALLESGFEYVADYDGKKVVKKNEINFFFFRIEKIKYSINHYINMDTERIASYCIPILFVIGILAFIFIPPTINVYNFIAYMASLSTAIMVLVYLVTTYQQLNVMKLQLDEMSLTRQVESKPLVSLNKMKAEIDLPRYYTGPESDFKKLQLLTRIFIRMKATNVGNAPAISVEFSSNICDTNQNHLIDSFGKSIDLLTLKDNDSKEISLVFFDEDGLTIESLNKDYQLLCNLLIVYKNMIGSPFKEEMIFSIRFGSPNNLKLIKESLKIIKTNDLEFGDECKEYERLMETGKIKDADKIIFNINEKIDKITSSIKNHELTIILQPNSFKITPIKIEEYDKIINDKEMTIKKLLELR